MSRVKMIVGLFIAVLAVGAVASASASAAGWMVAGTGITANEPLATSAAVDKKAVLEGGGITIECTGNLNGVSPQLEPGGNGGMASATSLTFTSCTANGGTCTVNNGSVTTEPVLVEATLEGTLAVVAAFKPKTGTLFANVELGGIECSVSGTQPITGEAEVLAPTGQDERTLQLINAITLASSGKLKIGSAGAMLLGSALLKLANSKPWSLL